MVEVEVDPERVVLLEHLAQLVVDPLRQEDRDPRADPDDLDVGDLAEAAEDRLEQLRGERQAVAAGDEHVADLGGPAQVVELGFVVLAVEVLGRVAHDPGPGAVAAVARALGRDQHQDPVRVAMDEAGHRGVAVLGERVLHHPGEGAVLAGGRDDLQADRVVRVVRVDQADEVGRDVDPELVRRGEPLALVVGQVQDLLDLLEIVDPVAELPAPVVPLGVGHVLPARRTAADRGAPVGPSARAGSARFRNGASAAARAASWCATAVLISWASTRRASGFRRIKSMQSASSRHDSAPLRRRSSGPMVMSGVA